MALAGVAVSVTGAFERERMGQAIRRAGGRLDTLVHKNLHVLVADDAAVQRNTQRVRKACKLGVPIVRETFILESLRTGKRAKVEDHLLQVSKDGDHLLQVSKDGDHLLQVSKDGDHLLQVSKDGDHLLQVSKDGESPAHRKATADKRQAPKEEVEGKVRAREGDENDRQPVEATSNQAVQSKRRRQLNPFSTIFPTSYRMLVRERVRLAKPG
ncbi:hypothetical protein GUITHDRAFT_122984 [Guillardia theta CCMP2712]|uniref:BRCT domain-containing protein n=1 Tax=Guillardia theta (strain CCMP2712) TaxID=905079 RepID=L1I3K8_GUITC|nr:hypothetical protein GUITHDRAFT_122984 [Guillardia theta CCMP2712]EKX30803.1 hypothetical protein GUITHDRAFT_122984 [Guillardia theta CCMP2712]|eukprot:XP_005817783.1 hypothetical protein GUITHDRAFT_122984 [Guillardia theta CCMP2712]